jgi:hypothetical protein
MNTQNEARNTAIIYNFPTKARIAANRIAEQKRRLNEFEAAAAENVVDATGWYHDDEIAKVGRA